MIHPGTKTTARRRCPGDQAVLERPVLPFNDAVALGVVSRCETVLDAEESRQLGTQPRSKLAPLVGDDGGRDAEPGNPMTEESLSAVLGRNGGQGNSFQPSRKAIDDCKKVL